MQQTSLDHISKSWSLKYFTQGEMYIMTSPKVMLLRRLTLSSFVCLLICVCWAVVWMSEERDSTFSLTTWVGAELLIGVATDVFLSHFTCLELFKQLVV